MEQEVRQSARVNVFDLHERPTLYYPAFRENDKKYALVAVPNDVKRGEGS